MLCVQATSCIRAGITKQTSIIKHSIDTLHADLLTKGAKAAADAAASTETIGRLDAVLHMQRWVEAVPHVGQPESVLQAFPVAASRLQAGALTAGG